MLCKKCGFQMNEDADFCPNCGAAKEIQSEEKRNNLPILGTIYQKKKIIFIIGALLIILFGGIIFFLSKSNEREKILMNIEKNNHLKFPLNGEDFYLGDTTSSFKEKNLTYEDDYLSSDDRINSDSISVQPFYHNEEEQFLGSLYCAKKESCKYEDSILVKANFYSDSEVIIDDYIKFGMSYDDVVKKYGKEDGKFYQGNNSFVWSFGEKGKIGEPYYILTFDQNWLVDMGGLVDIRVGVWWYENEYEHTVIKEK